MKERKHAYALSRNSILFNVHYNYNYVKIYVYKDKDGND